MSMKTKDRCGKSGAKAGMFMKTKVVIAFKAGMYLKTGRLICSVEIN